MEGTQGVQAAAPSTEISNTEAPLTLSTTGRNTQTEQQVSERRSINDSDDDGEDDIVVLHVKATPQAPAGDGTSLREHHDDDSSGDIEIIDFGSTAPAPPQVSSNQINIDSSAIVANSEDSGSELSDIDEMPPPPTAALRQPVRRHAETRIECTHTTWCTCPMHASYNQKKKAADLPHISNWALAVLGDEAPESSVRSTANLSASDADGEFVNTRNSNILKTTRTLLRTLPKLSNMDKVLHGASEDLVHQLNSYMDPNNAIRSRPSNPMTSIIEMVEDVADQWKQQNSDAEQLVARFWRSIETHPDLAVDLSKICPQRMRTGRWAALKFERKRLLMRGGFEDWKGRRPSGWRFKGFP